MKTGFNAAFNVGIGFRFAAFSAAPRAAAAAAFFFAKIAAARRAAAARGAVADSVSFHTRVRELLSASGREPVEGVLGRAELDQPISNLTESLLAHFEDHY